MSLKKKLLKIAKMADSKIASHVKTAYAILQLANLRRRKFAFLDDRAVNRTIKEELMKAGIERKDVLNANWAKPIIGTLQKFRGKFDWTDAQYEDILADTFEDFLLGENLSTGGKWSQGTLPEQVKTWLAQGKEPSDMLGMLGYAVAQKAKKRGQKYFRGPGGGQRTQFEQQQKGDDDWNPYQVADEVFQMEGVGKGQAGKWMRLVQTDPELKAGLNMVEKKLERMDRDIYNVWKAYRKEPDFKSANDLGEVIIDYRDPETGRKKEGPLWKALGKEKNTSMYYYMNKLKDVMKKMWPNLKDYIKN